MTGAKRPLLRSAIFLCAAVVYAQNTSGALTFREAANRAVAVSRELRNETAARALKRDAWVLGRRAYFPKLTLQASEDERLSAHQADSFQKNYSLNVDQLLFDGGRLASARRLERAELALSLGRLDTLAGDIAESAVSAYREIVTARAAMGVREAGFTALKGQRQVLQKEVELGLVLQSELDQADIALAEARIEIMSLEMELEEKCEQFLVMLDLDAMPDLVERIDVYRQTALPEMDRAVAAALERNQELKAAALSIRQRKEQARFAALSWLPSLRATGTFSLAGGEYPLTKYSWQAGLSVEFANPWLNANTNGSAGFQGKNDRTARLSGTFVPLPDPAASLSAREARRALLYEQQKYAQDIEMLPRAVKMARGKCVFADRRRLLALEAARLAKNKLEVFAIKRRLGQITPLEFMDAQNEAMQTEIALIQAAAYLLAVEREFERLLDLQPGELGHL